MISRRQGQERKPGSPSSRPRALLGSMAALCVACSGVQGQQLRASKLGDVSLPLAGAAPGGALAAASCGDGAPTDAGRARLARLPYLQSTSASAVTVLFTTSVAGQTPPGLELSSPSGELLRTVTAVVDPAATDGRQHVARLHGLQPGSTYCYALRGWTARTGLRTAPRAGSGEAVHFVVFGDSGKGTPGQLAVRDQLSQAPFELILHTGDVAYDAGTLDALERTFFDVYADHLRNAPVFPTTGNHDYRTASAAPFRQVFALPENGGELGRERWYSFDFGDVHFVALDTERRLEAQRRWLARDLAHNRLPWTIVYLHRPPYSSGDHGSDRAVRRAFVPLFERHGVQLVLAGHDHHYERTIAINGVTYLVTGGGGRGTRPVGSSWFTAFSESTLHLVAGRVERDTLVLHAIDGTGQQFDSARLSL